LAQPAAVIVWSVMPRDCTCASCMNTSSLFICHQLPAMLLGCWHVGLLAGSTQHRFRHCHYCYTA
jgi:hypothetical protein